MDLSDGVAVRIASLAREPRGRLSGKLLSGTAVRGGLLVDLALAGRMESAEESVVVDPTPTGFGPADNLLAAIGVEPERSLDDWLDETRIGLRDVAAANVLSGRWALRPGPWGLGRRYADLRPDETARDASRRPATDVQGWSRVDAAVTALAAAAGLLDRNTGRVQRAPQAVLDATGPAAWLCGAVVDHLLVVGDRYRSQAAALGAGTVGPF